MSKNKKPTMMEMKNVMTNVIQHLNIVESNLKRVDFIITNYIDYNKDSDKFTDWVKKTMEENKDKEVSDGKEK